MTYSAKTADELRKIKGLRLDKIAAELKLIDTELDAKQAAIDANATAIDLHKSKFMLLTPTEATLAASGVDLASGSDIEIHGFFFPVNVTLVKMHDYLTEAYVKDTTDAKIEVYDEAGTKLFGRTLDAGGEPAKQHTQTDPEDGAENVNAGTGIYLKATNTGATSGTGHAAVIIEYIER